MSGKKAAAIIAIFILAVLACMFFFGGNIKQYVVRQGAIDQINKSLEMSLNLKSGNLETEILEGSYYPKDAPREIQTTFEVDKPNKDKNTRNINFDVVFTYASGQKDVSNITNYEGLYLNIYYPFSRYNKINEETVKSVEVNKTAKGKEYIIYYKDSHLSRRMEWEYCKVQSDYEYFLIDKNDVILQYISETRFKQEDDRASDWVDGKSYLKVELKDYTLVK
ncbi:hypothetical protein [Aminipila sp.]|uniref:hypothetical protein n=1 Tax=Aminipila sp. TaxID=2060095 RepID=UPI002898790E|nr:hypothetical protein [Aminipila sp.]